MESYDVVALGELLIDFAAGGVSEQGSPLFEANPGGAPCNVLAMLRKLGRTCAFIGKVGDDMFGHQLHKAISAVGIATEGLLFDASVRTTLAFVKNLPDGDRVFSFYRNPGADMMLTEWELPSAFVRNARVFHFGSLSLTHEPARQATKAAVAMARDAGALISFDPNLRELLWESLDEAKEQIEWGLSHSDVVKIADNELAFVTGEEDADRGVQLLRSRFPGVQLLTVTAGAKGSCAYYGNERVIAPACTLGNTIDTTGAGDTFCACVLNDVLERGLDALTADDLRAMLRFANAAAYLVTTRKGALRSMPEKEQVLALIR